MRKSPLISAALLLLGACATAPAEPEPLAEEVLGVTERYGPLIESAANTLVAAEPAGAVPAGLRIDVQSVEETDAGLFYSAELHATGRRRWEEDYVIYGQCAASDLAACASQIVAGARMLAKPDAR